MSDRSRYSRQHNSSSGYSRDRNRRPRDYNGGKSRSSSMSERPKPTEWEYAIYHLGLNTKFLRSSKPDSDPKLTRTLGLADYYPPNSSNPEEKFYEYVLKGEGYVEPLPTPIAANKHHQYGSMLDRSHLVFAQQARYLKEKNNQTQSKRHGLISFLKSNVRALGGRMEKEWMEELASGKQPLSEIIQTLGIAQHAWEATDQNLFPLLEKLAKYQPAYARATWFVKVNVLYTEITELSHDSTSKFGDWSFDRIRFQKRSEAWTRQLIKYISARMRVSTEQDRKKQKVEEESYFQNRTEWLYVIRLAQWQFESGLLDRTVYFDGLIQLMHSMMKEGSNTLRVDDCYLVVSTIMHHLSQIYRSGDQTRDLIQACIQNLNLFPSTHSFISSRHELLFKSFCEILRCTLVTAPDSVVRIGEDFSTWPSYIFETQHCVVGLGCDIQRQQYIQSCVNMKNDILRRVERLREYYSNLYVPPSRYSEAEVIQALDQFHAIGTDFEAEAVYPKVFHVRNDQIVDSSAVFLICEWAITMYRFAPYRTLSAAALLEMHAEKLQNQQTQPPQQPNRKPRQLVLQQAVQKFLLDFEPGAIPEYYRLMTLMAILVRRRLFSVNSFMRYLIACGLVDPGSSETLSSSAARFNAYSLESGPNRGYIATDLKLLSAYDRCLLYLWHMPRGSDPPPNSLCISRTRNMSNRLVLNQWLVVSRLTLSEVSKSNSLRQAQQQAVEIFCLYRINSTDEDHLTRELQRQAGRTKLFADLKRLCAHDKGCFASWILDLFFGRQSYRVDMFQIDPTIVTVEDMLRLVLEILHAVDVESVLDLLKWLLAHATTFLVRTVVLPLIHQFELAFNASDHIVGLLQSFVDRFRSMSPSPDDECRTIGKCFGEIYHSHKKKSGVDIWDKSADIPSKLLTEIARETRNRALTDQSTSADSLDMTMPLVRTPRINEAPTAEMQKCLTQAMTTLRQAIVDTTSTKPLSQISLDVALSGDASIDVATKMLRGYCSRPNEQVFLLRTILMEVMERWVGAAAKHKFVKRTCPMGTPVIIHRCVRVLRELIEYMATKKDVNGSEFRESFANTLLVWLFREVVPAFAGTDPGTSQSSRTKNPYVNGDHGKEAFQLNKRGQLDMYQTGLRAFVQSLLFHGVVQLQQVLRLVLVPGFPQQRKYANGAGPSLGSQLLTMTLVTALFSDPSATEQGSDWVNYTDDTMISYLRYLRSQLPISMVFPLIHRLCKIAYQMDKSFQLRKRDERGTVAALVFFALTADTALREILVCDTKRLSENYILPLYKESQWYAAVLLSQICRPLHQPAEDKDGRVHLLKPEQILDAISVWTVNRGGWLLLNLQLERQQVKQKQKQKETKQPMVSPPAIPTTGAAHDTLPPLPPPVSPPPLPTSNPPGTHETPPPLPASPSPLAIQTPPPLPPPLPPMITGTATTPDNKPNAPLPTSATNQELELETNFGEAKDASESLAHLVILRIMRPTSRSRTVTPATLLSKSPMPSPMMISPQEYDTPTEMDVSTGGKANGKAQEAESRVNLYASLICCISRRALAAALVELQEILKRDVTSRSTRSLNTKPVLLLLRGLLCHASAQTQYPMVLNGLIEQLQWILEGCRTCDAQPESIRDSILIRWHEKLTLRLQLIAIITPYIRRSTDGSDDRLAQVLLSLLTTNVVQISGKSDLFTYILDMLQLIQAKMMQENHVQVLSQLNLSDELKQRVEMIFSRPIYGSCPIFLNDPIELHDQVIESTVQLDPWTTLQHVPDAPSVQTLLLGSDRVEKNPQRFYSSF